MSASTVPAFAYTCEFCRQPLPQDQSKWGHVSVPFGGQDDSDCTFWCAECWEKAHPKCDCITCGVTLVPGRDRWEYDTDCYWGVCAECDKAAMEKMGQPFDGDPFANE